MDPKHIQDRWKQWLNLSLHIFEWFLVLEYTSKYLNRGDVPQELEPQ